MLFNIPIRKIRIGLLVLIGLLAVALVPAAVIGRSKYAPALAATGPLGTGVDCTTGTTFNLKTTNGYFSAPDGNQIYMWSYTMDGNDFQTPGPMLCVDEGDTVIVSLTNVAGTLTGATGAPLPDENASIIFPGQIDVSPSMVSGTGNSGLFTLEAESGETVEYTFTAGEPGTYLYESGTNQHKQVHMGLYGSLIVYSQFDEYDVDDEPVTRYAYNLKDAFGVDTGGDPASIYNPKTEYLFIFHEIDPELHAAVERDELYDVTDKLDRYWTMNGRSFPDIIAPNGADWLPGQPYSSLVVVEAHYPNAVLADGPEMYHPPYPLPGYFKPALIRYANAGWENHPFHPHGNNMQIIGRDGRRLSTSFNNFTITIASGQTYDLLFTWDDEDGWLRDDNKMPIGAHPIPDYLNRVYKDGSSFFSGDPYLGAPEANDYFPPDTTLYNICGEYYFPWHSHAIHEIQNFDEGFGGMLTAVAVLPAGRCGLEF